MNCQKCGSHNEENAKFCNDCGTSLSMQGSTERVGNVLTTNGKKKGGCFKSLLIGIISLFVIFLLIGILSDNDEINSNNQSGIQSNTSAKRTEESINVEQFKQEVEQYPYQDLARNPKDYKGKKVVFTGKVVQVLESGNKVQYRVNVTQNDYGYEDTIYVFYTRSNDESRILEDDLVTLWGVSDGLFTYTSTIGGQITIPQINAVAIENMN